MSNVFAHPTTFAKPHELEALQLATGRIAIPHGHSVCLVPNKLLGRRKPRDQKALGTEGKTDDC